MLWQIPAGARGGDVLELSFPIDEDGAASLQLSGEWELDGGGQGSTLTRVGPRSLRITAPKESRTVRLVRRGAMSAQSSSGR